MFSRILFSTILFVISFCVVSTVHADAITELEEKVVVYNWEDYIPEHVLENFTRETGIKVEYSTFANNEVMYTRLKLLKGRGYDVLVPSTALVDKMAREGLIQPIDHRKLTNYQNLDPRLLNKSYDPGNQYSIPYLWGTTGIGINTAKVDKNTVTRWSDLWNAKWRNKLLLIDDMGEVFDMVLKVNKDPASTTDPEKIKAAYDSLRSLMPNIKVITSDPDNEFSSGNVDLGIVWNGEMAKLNSEDPKFQYIYPEEGASVWIDSFVIPARASHVSNAHKFIDYMLRPDIAALCVKELGYATPNLAGKGLLDKSIKDNPIIFPPPESLANAEFKRDIGDAQNLYLLYWYKLKGGE